MLFRPGVVLSASWLFGAACSAVEPPAPAVEARTASAVSAKPALTFADRAAECAVDPRVVAGVVTADVCIGADLFLRETFGGNGRSCATCHAVDDNFALDPAFISKLPPSDPLFVAEFNSDLAGLEIPAQMRRFGLILENVDGFEPDPTTHFVLRSVPHTLSLATSVTRAAGDTVNPPIERTGWSGDGAPGAGGLRDFQTGAITQHYTQSLSRISGTDFRLATDDELDTINAFMRQIGRSNELALATVTMSDAGAEAGRARFLTVGCNGCHSNAGANAAFGGGGNRNFNTGVESARHPDLAGFPRDGGFLASPANSDGSFGNGTFNAPPLVEAADTGPFFHTATSITGASAHNTEVATTIEEAIAFYDSPAFNSSPSGLAGPINMTAEEIDNIGRFLRGVNATFNAAMTVKRLDAVIAVIATFGNGNLAVQRELVRLAGVELGDAIRVLSEVTDLNTGAIDAFTAARVQLGDAAAIYSAADREAAITAARDAIAAASASIGTNLTYDIGAGSVMF